MTAGGERRRSPGFSLAEIIVIVALGTVVAMALYKVVVVQQRFYRHERAISTGHDALRLATSVLTTSLMEANSSDGDFGFIAAESLSIRSPVGFAIVCDVDTTNLVLGLFDIHGRIGTKTADSVLVYDPSGWLVRRVKAINPSTPALSCPYASGPSLERRVRVDSSVSGVPVGAPVRAFHPYRYRLEQDAGSWWLARDDGTTTDILAGPFTGVGSGLVFSYLDTLGQTTSIASEVARVDLTLVTEAQPGTTRQDSIVISTALRNYE